MNKKQIIKLLDKEVGLFHITENENSLGELYISELNFKKVSELFEEIKKLRIDLKESIKFYKGKIQKNEKGYYVKLSSRTIIKDKQFNYDGDFIILDPKNVVMMNNIFYGKGLNG